VVVSSFLQVGLFFQLEAFYTRLLIINKKKKYFSLHFFIWLFDEPILNMLFLNEWLKFLSIPCDRIEFLFLKARLTTNHKDIIFSINLNYFKFKSKTIPPPITINLAKHK